MKKLLFILFTLLFCVSCSNDEQKNIDDQEYIDVNILNGKWEGLIDNDTKGIYEFINGHVIYTLTKDIDVQIWVNTKFKLTKSEILYSTTTAKGDKESYIINNDSLFITDLIGEKYKYIKTK